MKRNAIYLMCACLLLAPGSLTPAALAKQKPPENGKFVQYYPGGKRVYEISWRKQGRVVRRKVFFRNGKLYRDVIYKDGKRIVERVYFDTGRLKSVWTQKTGEMKIFDKKGKLRRTISTSPDGLTKDLMPRSLIFRQPSL